jgi:hypothetical protein
MKQPDIKENTMHGLFRYGSRRWKPSGTTELFASNSRYRLGWRQGGTPPNETWNYWCSSHTVAPVRKGTLSRASALGEYRYLVKYAFCKTGGGSKPHGVFWCGVRKSCCFLSYRHNRPHKSRKSAQAITFVNWFCHSPLKSLPGHKLSSLRF